MLSGIKQIMKIVNYNKIKGIKMNFNFLKTKHYYYYQFETYRKNKIDIKGYRVVEVISFFWVKPSVIEIIEFAENELKKELKIENFVITKLYKV